MNPNRYDLILLFAVVSGIYYVIDETLSSTNNAPKTAETLPVLFSVPRLARVLDQKEPRASYCRGPRPTGERLDGVPEPVVRC